MSGPRCWRKPSPSRRQSIEPGAGLREPATERPDEFVISPESETVPGSEIPSAAEFEISAESPASDDTPVFEISAESEAPSAPSAESHEGAYELPALELPVEAPKAAVKPPAPPAKAPEPEFELEQDYELVLDPEPIVPAYDQRPPETPVVPKAPEPEAVAHNAAPSLPGNGLASDQFLADLANEIDSLGIGGLRQRIPSRLGTTRRRRTPPRPKKSLLLQWKQVR